MAQDFLISTKVRLKRVEHLHGEEPIFSEPTFRTSFEPLYSEKVTKSLHLSILSWLAISKWKKMEGGTTQENQWFFSRHWKCTVSVPCIYQRHTDDKNFYWKTLAAILLNKSDGYLSFLWLALHNLSLVPCICSRM